MTVVGPMGDEVAVTPPNDGRVTFQTTAGGMYSLRPPGLAEIK